MENNKLIAEFMQYPNHIDEESGETSYIIDSVHCVDYNLDFHTSWDWLMPVVKKCRLESRCEYDEDDNWNEIHWALEECNLDKTHKTVVKFIKQYNK